MFKRKPKTQAPPPSEPAIVIPDDLVPVGKPPKKGGSPCGLVPLIVLVLVLGAGGYFVYTRFIAGGGGESPLAIGLPGAAEQAPSLEQAPPPEQPTIDVPLAALPDATTSENPDAAATKAAKKKNKANKANQQEQQAQPAAAPENTNPNPDPNAAANPPPVANAPAPGDATLGLLDRTPGCGGHPTFLDQLGLAADAQFSTNIPGTRGLFVTGSGTKNGGAPIKYQHQSWSSAGYLDAFVVDSQGNVYLAPSPRTGPGVSEPSNQDQIFRVASTTGLLTPFLELPAAAPASPENQYGVLGLALDCANNILYATSIAGSTPGNVAGRIFEIDTTSGQVIGQLDKVDGYGVAVRNTAGGTQLYFGSVDDPQIRAIDLDATGNFKGEPRPVASLADPQRARRILFTDDGQMVVQAVEFNFQNGDIPQGSPVRFTYDAATDTWALAQ